MIRFSGTFKDLMKLLAKLSKEHTLVKDIKM